MLALDEGEVLGGGEREARRQQPLRGRVAREVQEQRRALERAALLEAAAEELRAVVAARRCRRTRSRSRRRVAPAPRSRAWRAISTARRSCGRPPPEKIGSFWPRTRLFMRSSVVTPVSMKSRGHGARHRVDRQAVDAVGARAPAIGGPPSITWPTPLNTRPEDAGRQRRTSAARRRSARRCSASVEPGGRLQHLDRHERRRRARPRGRGARGRRCRVTSTASYRPTSSVRRRKSSGPSSRVAAPSTGQAASAGLRSRADERRELAFERAPRARRSAPSSSSPISSPMRCSGRSARQPREPLGRDARGHGRLGEVDEARR